MADLSKDLAKQASAEIQKLAEANEKLAADYSAVKEKLAALEKERECMNLAIEMAENGQFTPTVESINKMAQELLSQDLDVVKKAMTLAADGLRIGSPVGDGPSVSDGDPITEYLLNG